MTSPTGSPAPAPTAILPPEPKDVGYCWRDVGSSMVTYAYAKNPLFVSVETYERAAPRGKGFAVGCHLATKRRTVRQTSLVAMSLASYTAGDSSRYHDGGWQWPPRLELGGSPYRGLPLVSCPEGQGVKVSEDKQT